jgi:pimeloyl-ACP methyl ester carboxylesterase
MRGFANAAVAVGLACLTGSIVEAVVVTESVQAPAEPCDVDGTHDFTGPQGLVDCPDEFCARLTPGLRSAARTRDARELLIRSALESYTLRRPELPHGDPRVAQALADLAVTGSAAYESFRRLAPNEPSLTEPLRQRIQGVFPAHAPVADDVSAALQQTLRRAYQVAWALRGPAPYRAAHRNELGWIAISGQDDPPHRPVNVLSAPFAQRNATVRVRGIDVLTRYMVASRHIADDDPVDLRTVPPEREHPLIIGDVVLFIHGHSSSVEEALTLAGPLLAQADARGRAVTLVAMDLPGSGYASMIDDTLVAPSSASRWNTAYPILDFMEEFVVGFVDVLEQRQPGIKGQIVGVIGGSLGGNLTLRLARRDPVAYPWLRSVVSWSPASSWDSWERQARRDLEKRIALDVSRTWMSEAEGEGSLGKFFHGLAGTGGRIEQSKEWYSPSWPCAENAKMSSHRALAEIYNERFRRWHFRVAYEQLIYSHWDSDNPDPSVDPDPRVNPAAGPARYTQIRSRMLLAAGAHDDSRHVRIFTNTKELARAMTMVSGEAFFLEATGHSIHTEKPAFFARRILDFLFVKPPPPFPAFLVPATTG